jgi:hypothetical protein
MLEDKLYSTSDLIKENYVPSTKKHARHWYWYNPINEYIVRLKPIVCMEERCYKFKPMTQYKDHDFITMEYVGAKRK